MRVLIRWDRFWGDTVWLGGNGTASGTPDIKGAGAIQGVNWGFRGRLPVVRNSQFSIGVRDHGSRGCSAFSGGRLKIEN